MIMKTDKIAEDLRKLTLSTEFSYEEFKKIIQQNDLQSGVILDNLMKDCHIKPVGKSGFVVVHGKERKELIVKRIGACEVKIREWYGLLTHLKEL